MLYNCEIPSLFNADRYIGRLVAVSASAWMLSAGLHSLIKADKDGALSQPDTAMRPAVDRKPAGNSAEEDFT